MTDLLANPEAVTVNPGDARRIAEINRLRPVPKPSTTSYASTGDGGVTPVRAADAEERRKAIHAIQNPPEIVLQKRWDDFEARWKAKDEAYEKEKSDQQAALRTAEERRLAEVNREIARKKAKQAFDANEATMDLCLGHLTLQERGRVMQKLLNAGKIHDFDLAGYYAQEEVVNRGTAPVEDRASADWRGGVKKRK